MKGFGQITRKYIGKSFEECNCLELLYNIYTDLGIKVPDKYKGFDLKTYFKYWESNPDQAIKDMIELFETIGEEVNPKYLKRGDLIVVDFKKIRWPAIYLGENKIMSVSMQHGARVLIIGKTIFPVIARRLI